MGFIKRIVEAVETLQGLSDHVLSVLLREQGFADGDFRLVAVESEHLVFTVPPQDRNLWYTKDKNDVLQLSPQKEKLAKELCSTFRLGVFHPPDTEGSPDRCSISTDIPQHHFEFHPASYLEEVPLARVHPGYFTTIACDRSNRIDPESLFTALKRFYLE